MRLHYFPCAGAQIIRGEIIRIIVDRSGRRNELWLMRAEKALVFRQRRQEQRQADGRE